MKNIFLAAAFAATMFLAGCATTNNPAPCPASEAKHVCCHQQCGKNKCEHADCKKDCKTSCCAKQKACRA